MQIWQIWAGKPKVSSLVLKGGALGILALLCFAPVYATPDPASVFALVWKRYDQPVAEQRTSRSWTWGPAPITLPMSEPFAGVATGQRTVQYYDKGRMELNDPSSDPQSPWYVTSGLLPYELMTGRRQVA